MRQTFLAQQRHRGHSSGTPAYGIALRLATRQPLKNLRTQDRGKQGGLESADGEPLQSLEEIVLVKVGTSSA